MLAQLFSSLNQGVSGAPLVALIAATGWGILSVILSPCHLASIPLIIGFVDGQGRISTKRAFFMSCLFAIGILLSIALIGLLTAWAGRLLGDLGPWGNYLVAGVLFIFGLHLWGVLPTPWDAVPVNTQRKGLLAAFLIGLIFGIALGPCTFAFMGPVLSVVFTEASKNLVYAFSLVLAYAAGHCTVIVLAGSFTEKVQRYLAWNERSQGPLRLKRVCGLLVMAGGAWIIYSAP